MTTSANTPDGTDVNATGAPFSRDACIHELFEQQVRLTPDSVALEFEELTLSYRDLNARADQLARHLQRLGARREVLVGICVERSIEMIVGILGVLKAGAAYVPLDPAYPRERLAYMLKDANCPLLLTQHQLRPMLPIYNGNIVELGGDLSRRDDVGTRTVEGGVAPENLAYVIYTSGSTGRPKGALISHRNLVHSTMARFDFYRTAPRAYLLVPSFAFDSSVAGIFWTLCSGGRLVLMREGSQYSADELGALIERRKVSHLLCLPSLYAGILSDTGPAKLESLQCVIVAGEACPGELVRRHASALPRAELYNEYGPTECTVWATAHRCSPDDTGACVPIGTPISNTRVHILDEQLQPVPAGTPGELCISGEGVARGYLNAEALTAEKFIRDPFNDNPLARMYRTGDRARLLSDGAIEFLGRLDQQVKIRGYRIELGEVEAVLAGHAQVRECVVLAREDRAGDRRLVAYVIPDAGGAPTISDIRNFIQKTLPEYMLPDALMVMETFPRTASGKVDRNALPPPGRARPRLNEEYVAPRDALEKRIARIWCDLLQLDSVGVHDKFFELGGNSLKGAAFISALQKELGEFIYVVTLFEAPSIAQFADFLKKDYAAAVARKFGTAEPQTPVRSRKVDAAMVARMRQHIPSLPATSGGGGRVNSRAIFILSPPRSGTTLLRVMLAGHPQLFSATELQLLGFNTLGERRSAFSGKHSLWLEGTIRAIMEIKGCDADAARQIMEEFEQKNLSTREFYGLLQSWIPEKTLVDKSPSYVFDLETLKKAERDFDGALYIHLVRHPYAMTTSFEKLHMEQALYLHEHPFTSRELAEMLWLISHQNTLEFLAGVPRERQFRMRFEDLTAQPEFVMREMCRTLGLPWHEELIQPYKDVERKMTDGLYTESTPMGDEKFLKHRRIDPNVAERWKQVEADDFLSDLTWDMAERLGYSRPGQTPAVRDAGARIDLLHRQRQLRARHPIQNVEELPI